MMEHGAKEVIRDAIEEAMAEGAQVGVKTHEKHHRWIDT